MGVLLFCVLLQGAVEKLAREGVPILQEFFLKWVCGKSVRRSLRAKSMFRFKELLNSQIRVGVVGVVESRT